MRSLIALYLPVACVLFCIFLSGFLTDDSASKTDLISWMAVLIGAVFFPIVIPVALTEKLLKAGLPQPDRILKPRLAYRNRTSG
jgi:threonine/homoserine/homoserine lactone efflux protein